MDQYEIPALRGGELKLRKASMARRIAMSPPAGERGRRVNRVFSAGREEEKKKGRRKKVIAAAGTFRDAAKKRKD